MADNAICKQIGAFLTPKFASRRIRLRFTYNGREYTTIFTAEHDDTEIRIKNPTCIDISYNYEALSFVTNIQADISDPACFTPRLVSNIRSDPGAAVAAVAAMRTTTMDVLSVLMTKLCMCFPKTIVDDAPITVTDMATKDSINLSAFHLVRGGPAIYEKYGYESPSVRALRDRIQNLRWQELKQSAKELVLLVYKESKLPGLIRNDDLVMNIVRRITYDIESTFNQNHMGDPFYGGPDDINFSEFMIIYLTDADLYSNEFILNASSPEWINWSSKLIFTGFEELGGGGEAGKAMRKTRRRKTRRRKTQKRV